MTFYIEGGDFTSAGKASSEVKKVLKHLNINPGLIRRTAVALYEAEVNVVAHAFKGEMHVEISSDEIKVVLQDEGPGIDDIEQAMQEGWSTASDVVREMGFGAGMGLPNIKRNVDDMQLQSEPGSGTRMEFKINLIAQE
ncbi:MAG TPA: ATP-binding protein [Bacteroidales bacterium]|nr:ATP-binding protein [Bacteroidales bacterium]